jgi:ribosomal protein L10
MSELRELYSIEKANEVFNLWARLIRFNNVTLSQARNMSARKLKKFQKDLESKHATVRRLKNKSIFISFSDNKDIVTIGFLKRDKYTFEIYTGYGLKETINELPVYKLLTHK